MLPIFTGMLSGGQVFGLQNQIVRVQVPPSSPCWRSIVAITGDL